MRRGYFDVTQELTVTKDWPVIKSEIDKVFELHCKENLPNGVIRFHGNSHLFDECNELESIRYTVIFSNESGSPKLLKVERFDRPTIFKHKMETR